MAQFGKSILNKEIWIFLLKSPVVRFELAAHSVFAPICYLIRPVIRIASWYLSTNLLSCVSTHLALYIVENAKPTTTCWTALKLKYLSMYTEINNIMYCFHYMFDEPFLI